MKIFILGNWNLGYSWFIRTFKQGFQLLGHEVDGMDLKANSMKDIKSYISSVKPDYLFDHMSFRPWPFRSELFEFFHTMRQGGTKVIHVLGDAYLERYKGDLRDMFDCVLLGKKQNMKKLRKAWKVPIHYCLYSTLVYDNIAKPVRKYAYPELVFTGKPNIHEDRSVFLRKLVKHMPVRVFQTQSSNDKRNVTRELSASCTAIAGFCTGYDVDGYMNSRPTQYLGAGACMIMRKFKNMDQVIPEDLYYPFDSYDNPGVVKELFERAKKEDTWPMRRKAFEFMQTHHNCKKRMQDVINVVEGKKDYIPQLIEEL